MCFRRQPALRESIGALALLLLAPTAPVHAQAAIGLSSVRAQGFQNESLLFYTPEVGDRFGWALASGDFNGDGKIDLFNFDDSIASVGRYLSENGFSKGKSKAVWAYNHEAAYVEGVLAFAEALHGVLNGDGGVIDDEPDAGK